MKSQVDILVGSQDIGRIRAKGDIDDQVISRRRRRRGGGVGLFSRRARGPAGDRSEDQRDQQDTDR